MRSHLIGDEHFYGFLRHIKDLCRLWCSTEAFRIILPAPTLKRDNRYQRDKKRKRCRRRAAIAPITGHLKSDFRLSRNFLKGVTGDIINLLMGACAWNLNKWMRAILLFVFGAKYQAKIRCIVALVTPVMILRKQLEYATDSVPAAG